MNERQISFTIDAKVYDRVAKMAAGAGMATGRYVRILFEAAYSARCNPTSDVVLDDAVARAVVVHGEKTRSTVEIAAAVGLSEPTVIKIIEAWKAEIKTEAA